MHTLPLPLPPDAPFPPTPLAPLLQQIVGLPDIASKRSGSGGSMKGRRRRLQQLSEKSRAHMEMMQRMGIAQAASGMAPANEEAWAELTDYFRVGLCGAHDTHAAALHCAGWWRLGGAWGLGLQQGIAAREDGMQQWDRV